MDTQTLLGAAAGILIALVLISILVLIFRWLWNTTMPEVFGVKALSFGQAVKILILAAILFGGHKVVNVPGEISLDEPSAASQAG